MTTKRLADIAEVHSGYHARSRIEPAEAGSHFLLQLSDFNDDRTKVDSGALIRFSPSSVRGDQELRNGDVLFLAKGGKPFGFAVEDLPGPALAAGHFFILRPTGHVRSGYLAWALNQAPARRYFAKYSGGTRIQLVRRRALEGFPLTVPSIERQDWIIEVNRLMLRERELYEQLVIQKRKLWTAMCSVAANEKHLAGNDNG